MINNSTIDDFPLFKEWNKEASERIKNKIKDFGIAYKTISDWMKMPLPTFNDKVSGKSSFKLDEIAKICLLLGVNADEIIFGVDNFVKDYYSTHDAREQIKQILINAKAFETLGKLTADGFFDDEKTTQYNKVADSTRSVYLNKSKSKGTNK